MTEATEVQQYWDERARGAELNPNATTDDVYLRELEVRTLAGALSALGHTAPRILDLGCGDGYTTLKVAQQVKSASFVGVDYSDCMIGNALRRLEGESDHLRSRVEFGTGDATRLREKFQPGTFDVVISSRCLINLTSEEAQFSAVADIANILKPNGHYLAVENFEEGQTELNTLRTGLGLPEIPVRWHNLFFREPEYLRRAGQHFSKVKIRNFTSAYYYATRVIYSKYCQMKGTKPDYQHEIHQLAIDLPEMGNYSPIKLITHWK